MDRLHRKREKAIAAGATMGDVCLLCHVVSSQWHPMTFNRSVLSCDVWRCCRIPTRIGWKFLVRSSSFFFSISGSFNPFAALERIPHVYVTLILNGQGQGCRFNFLIMSGLSL